MSEKSLPCGEHCHKIWPPDHNGATEYHDLRGEPPCQAHEHCVVHWGIHYRMPVPNGVIENLKVP